MIVCDLDHFKDVNDNYDHEHGDRVLHETASAMRAALRSFELIYRYGGEEFVIALPGAELAEGREEQSEFASLSPLRAQAAWTSRSQPTSAPRSEQPSNSQHCFAPPTSPLPSQARRPRPYRHGRAVPRDSP